MAETYSLVIARVGETSPVAGAVMVHIGEDYRSAYIGTRLGRILSGVRENFALQPGTKVLCLVSNNASDDNYIVTAIPDPVTDSSKARFEMVDLLGGGNSYTEPVYSSILFDPKSPLSTTGGGTVADIAPGEWSMLNDLGGGVVVERFSASLQASEFCGVFTDSLTDSLILAGRERNDMSLTTETRDVVAKAEPRNESVPTRMSFRSIYACEAFGISGANEADAEQRAFVIDQDNPPAGRTPGDPTRALFKPKASNMAPRFIEIESAAVGGSQHSVVVPQFADGRFERVKATVAREHRRLDGTLAFESMRGIHIRKTSLIPEIPAHVISTDLLARPAVDPFELPESVLGDVGYCVLAHELHAFAVNVASGCVSTGAPETAESPSSKKQWLKPGTEHTLDVYPGAKPTTYYKSSAGIDIMPDGSVVITDAWGSQIIMAGGNIVITAPGDIYRLPGRNDVVLSGADVIARAKKDLDLSSTERDVRIKAERNLSVLGGNSGIGGVLIESQGLNTKPTPKVGAENINAGVVIKSAMNIVAEAVADIDVRSIAASLYLTAAGNVMSTAQQVGMFSELVIIDPRDEKTRTAGTDDGKVTSFNAYSAMFPGQVIVNNDVMVFGRIASESSIAGKAVGQSDVKIDAAVKENVKTVAKLSAGNAKAYTDGIGKSFAKDVMAKYTFSFRLDDEYVGKDSDGLFTLPAAVWHRRVTGAAGWSEPSAGETKTAPYPGRTAWDSGGFIDIVPIYFDPRLGYIPSQNDVDTTPPAAAKRSTPFSHYPIPT